MRLYTIQPEKFWEHCKSVGKICPDADKLSFVDEPEFMLAYEWMRLVMRSLLPNYSGNFPVWAWFNRPDLRCTAHAPKGEKCVLLTLEVPEERVVLSDFTDWHYPLNQWYLHLDDADNEDEKVIDRYWEVPLVEKIKSWWNMFHPERNRSHEPVYQACIDQVFLDEVKRVRPFVAR